MILDLKEVITQKKITSKIPKISLGCKKEIALQISETKINDLILLLLPSSLAFKSLIKIPKIIRCPDATRLS